MWWSRRQVFLGVAALGTVALVGCGFTPVYAPGGGGDALLGAVQLSDPTTTESYFFNRRFEERMGRANTGAPYRMTLSLDTNETELGATSGGDVTRIRINGEADYRLRAAGTGAQVLRGSTGAFASYSTTGSTVATRAAERDATERLMILLADQVIDDLLLRAGDLAE